MNTSYSGIGMTSQRTRMRMVERLRQQGIRDEIVLSVMGEVPRHLFVEEALADRAYDDVSLPIGFGQTISNPHTVARMTELARARGDQGDLNKVLEIGTGCGYQCAVLARVAKVVHSVERLVQLTAQARKNLRNARVTNARLRHGDGHAGMPTEAPFDVILMTAAATHVPKALREQLALGGRMILPMVKGLAGAGGDEQHLLVIDRTARGFSEKRLDAVKFVPLLPGTG